MPSKINGTQAPQKSKETTSSDLTIGEQLDLMEVGPENAKEITKETLKYRSAQSARLAALEQEVAAKVKLLALIKEAGLKPMDDGKTRCHCDGFTITVTPRDELVRVKEDGKGEE